MAKIKPKTKLTCARCGATTDISKNPHAFDGWAVYPVAICPDCIARAMQKKQEAEDRQAERLQAALALLEGAQ